MIWDPRLLKGRVLAAPLRWAVYLAARGVKEAREVLLDDAREADLEAVVGIPPDQRMRKIHRALRWVRKLHCSAGHTAEEDPRCIGVMTVDAAGVHLSCARCGDCSHPEDPDAVLEAMVEGFTPPDRCEDCAGYGSLPSGDDCPPCGATGKLAAIE